AIDPPADVGMALEDVDTPALIIDLDAFESNVQRMASDVKQAGIRLRPHAKTHKCAALASYQMSLGAIGVCCQKVSEAAALVDNGIPNVLISNEVVGARKIAALVALAARARVGVCVDHPDNVAALGSAAAAAGVELNVLVEIDVGSNRCGVAPGAPAVALAREIAKYPALRFEGLQAYQGRAQHLRTHAERSTAIARAVEVTADTVAQLEHANFTVETVAGAGTGTFALEAASGLYNELQTGSYVFMDADYARNQNEDGSPYDKFAHSLFVYTTVMSLPNADIAVVDAGLKASSIDSGLPMVRDSDGGNYVGASDEHGKLDLSDTNRRYALGDKLLLIPGHCDPTVNLYDWFVCVRNGTVEALWPIVARGAVY
ncbi:MAG: 3-hydroxy-D-aspartate aldolase, partial [Gammaproteobacteria bacterium]